MPAGSEPPSTYNGTFEEKSGWPTHTKLITVIFLFDWKVTQCLVSRFGSKEPSGVSSGILKFPRTVLNFRPPLNCSYSNELLLTYHSDILQPLTKTIYWIISTRYFTTASQEKNKNNNKKERIQICIQTFLHSNFASKKNALAKSLQSSSNLWLICFQQIIKFGKTY